MFSINSTSTFVASRLKNPWTMNIEAKVGYIVDNNANKPEVKVHIPKRVLILEEDDEDLELDPREIACRCLVIWIAILIVVGIPAIFVPIAISENQPKTIHEAIIKNDLEAAKNFIGSNKSLIDDQDEFGNPPLHAAIKLGNLPMVKELVNLQNCTEANNTLSTTFNAENKMALYFGIEIGQVEIAQFLVKNCKLDQETKNGPKLMTSLHISVQNGYIDVAEIILNKSSDALIEMKDSNQKTALYMAVESQNLALFKMLVNHGANKNSRNGETNLTPMHLASQNGDLEIAKILITPEGVNAVSDFPMGGYTFQIEHFPKMEKVLNADTPLHLAALNGHVDVAQLLIENGAKVDAMTFAFHWTPLHLAAYGGHDLVAKLLIHHGANVEAISNSKINLMPLHLAAIEGHLKVAEVLVENGATLKNGLESDLMVICDQVQLDLKKFEELELFKLLVENAETKYIQCPTASKGISPIFFAEEVHDNQKMSDILIQNGATMRYNTATYKMLQEING